MFSSYTSRMDKENIDINSFAKRNRAPTPLHLRAQARIPFPKEEFLMGDEFKDTELSFSLRDNLSPPDCKPSKTLSVEVNCVSHTSVSDDADSNMKCSTGGVICNMKGQRNFQCTDTSQGNRRDEQNAKARGLIDSFTHTHSWNSSSVKEYGALTAVHVKRDKHTSEQLNLTNGSSFEDHHLKPTSLTSSACGCTGNLPQSSSISLRSYHSTPDCRNTFQDLSNNGQMSNVRARRKRASGLPMRVPAVTLAKYREEEEEEKNSWYSRGLEPLSPNLNVASTDDVQECELKKSDIKKEHLEGNSGFEFPPQLPSESHLQKTDEKSQKLDENVLNAPVLSASSTTLENAASSNGPVVQKLPLQSSSGYNLLAPSVKMNKQGHVFVNPPMQTAVLQPQRSHQVANPIILQPMLHTPGPMAIQPQMGYPFTPIADNRPNYYTPYSHMTHPAATNIITVNGIAYSVLSLLGKGGSSKVYQVYEMEKKKLLAIKCVKLEDADESVSLAYRNEITLLQKLQHSDRVIKLYDHEYNEEKECLYAVIEKGDTDLASMIRNYAKNGQITSEMIKFYWSEMLRAVAVIHKAGIVHSDLKPANFLLVSGKLKLIDFGIARSIQTDMTSVFKDVQEGTFNYMSPEAIQDTAQVAEVGERGRRRLRIKIGVKSDVWSLGCILYNLVYGRTPFQHIPQPIAKMQAITNPKYTISFPTIVDSQLIDVMEKCLVRDPKQRPSIEELLHHPYLTDGTSKAATDKSEVKSSSVLDQLASLTPRSLVRVYQEFSKMLKQTPSDTLTTSPADRQDASC